MQSLNSSNLCLYQPEQGRTTFTSEYGREITIEVYNASARIEQLRAYTFHPNKTTWWSFIKNWLVEFFYGKTVVLVNVKGETYPLYMRVDDLKSVLKVSSQTIQKLASPEEATQFIASYQIRQTVQKIKRLAQEARVEWSSHTQRKIENLIQKNGYRSIFRIVDHPQFNSHKMITTLLKIEEQLASSLPQASYQNFSSQACYEFEIALPDIYIWKIENHKKIKINLNGCKVQEEDFISQGIESIKAILPLEASIWSEVENAGIRQLISHVGCKNILTALEHSQFPKQLMASTLLEIGRILAGHPCTDIRYQQSLEFEIAIPNIYVWKLENQKKIKLNIQDLKLVIEEVSKAGNPSIPPSVAQTQHSITSKTKAPIVSTDKEKQEFKYIGETFNVSSQDMKKIDALAARVGYANLINTLGGLNTVDSKRIMINTFIAIGNTFSVPKLLDGIFARFRLKYISKMKEGGRQITYAFAINKKDIFIAQEKLNEGGFKTVSSAIKINDLKDLFVRIKIKPSEDAGKAATVKNEKAIKEIRKEAKFLATVHENKKNHKGRSCIVLPYVCEILSKGEIVFFQKRYQDGILLEEASLLHQIHVLRDVAAGLSFIHELGFVHMDMKPGNFLFDGDLKSSTPVKGKVSDFGMTIEKGSRILGGTPLYFAPEAFHSHALANEKIDSFAFGITILEILDRRPTRFFGKMNQMQIDDEIAQYRKRVHMLRSKHEIRMKAALLDIAALLLKTKPESRLSCTVAEASLDRLAQACT